MEFDAHSVCYLTRYFDLMKRLQRVRIGETLTGKTNNFLLYNSSEIGGSAKSGRISIDYSPGCHDETQLRKKKREKVIRQSWHDRIFVQK